MTSEIPFDSNFWEDALTDSNLNPTEIDGKKHWQVEEIETDSGIAYEGVYKLSRDVAQLMLKIRKDSVLLKWDAKLPDYMMPGKGAYEMYRLIDAVTYDIPNKLRPEPHKTKKEIQESYKSFSKIRVEPISDEKPWKELSDEVDTAELAIRFASESSQAQPSSIHIIGKKRPLSLTESYRIDIHYLDLDQAHAQIKFLLQGDKDSIKNELNPEIMNWILGTHLYSDMLKDRNKTSQELSQLEVECIDRWIFGKGSRLYSFENEK